MESARDTLDNPSTPYNFEKDNKVGLAFEHIAQCTIKCLEYVNSVNKCVDHERNKDYKVYLKSGDVVDMEVKGDLKSVCTGNIFLEFQNTTVNKSSGVMCGDGKCIWFHFYFEKDNPNQINVLLTSKAFLRHISLEYRDNTDFFQPKEILNARGYAVAQSLFTEHLKNTSHYIKDYVIISYKLNNHTTTF